MRKPGPSLGGIVLRVAILIGVVVLATWGAHLVRDALNLQTPAPSLAHSTTSRLPKRTEVGFS